MHAGTGDPAGLGGLPDAPVCAVDRFAGERALEQGSNLFIVDAAGPTGTQLVIESGQAVLEETLSPLAHGGISPVQTTSDLGVSLSLRRPEYEFGPCHQTVRQNAGSSQEVGSVHLGQVQGQAWGVQ